MPRTNLPTCFAILVMAVTIRANAETVYPVDTVVATRGGVSVTMGDIDATLMGSNQRANIMNSPKRIEELIERLLINRQIAAEGRAQKLDESAEFKRAVELQSDRLLADQALNRMRENMDIGNVEALAKERYNVNPGAYAQAGNTTVRHILIRNDHRSDGEALQVAAKARERAVAGEDFLALVSEYSEEQSKDTNGGLVSNAESDGVDPAFVDAVKKLGKKGDISPVVKSAFGYHVILLIDRIQPVPRSFEQAKASIIKQIEGTMRDARLKEHVDQLKSEELVADPAVVASLRTRYLPANTSPAPAKGK